MSSWQVEEVLLTIEPTEAQGSHGRTQGGASDTAAANPPGSYLPDYAADGVAATLSSGVQMLAGGIEQILQLLRVEAR